MWSGRVTICAFPLLLVPSDDAHSLPINVIGKGMCVIVSGFLRWLYIMPSKPGVMSRGANVSSITDYSPVCLILHSIGYLHTLWKRSTKPFTKRLSRCGGKWTFIFVFFALCWPFAQSLNTVRFAWSWTRSDTFTPREDAPQNRLRNG